MKRCRSLILIALVTLLCTAAALAAWPTTFEGKPKLMQQEPLDAYFVWHDRDGVHLRATSQGDPHIFTGTITTDGKIENIMVKASGEQDFSRTNNYDRIRFRLTAAKTPAGIDFTIKRGETVKFDLEMDGHKIKPAQIFVGSESWNPSDSRFTISYCDDDEEEYRDCDTTVILGIDWFGWLFGPHHGGHGHGPHGGPHRGPHGGPHGGPEPRHP